MVLEENTRRGDDEKKLYMMYDQMYWHLTYGNIEHYDPVNLRPEMKDFTIYIDAISKSFAATGVRVGWALGPKKVIAKMRMILTHVGAWAPMAEQKAVAKYLKNSEAVNEFLAHMRAEIEHRLREIYQGFQNLKNEGFAVDAIAPEAAIYLTIQLNLAGKTTANGNLLNDQEAVTSYILNEAKLAVVPFYAFGSAKTSNWYRLSVGTCKKDETGKMLSQLKTALNKLN
jgi:aspartate aminotransferase